MPNAAQSAASRRCRSESARGPERRCKLKATAATIERLRIGQPGLCPAPVGADDTCANSTCSANQSDRLRMTPTTAAVIAASAPESRGLVAQALDIGCARHDPQEAGNESHPERDERGSHPAPNAAGLAIAGDEADEFGDQDQRARASSRRGPSRRPFRRP